MRQAVAAPRQVGARAPVRVAGADHGELPSRLRRRLEFIFDRDARVLRNHRFYHRRKETGVIEGIECAPDE